MTLVAEGAQAAKNDVSLISRATGAAGGKGINSSLDSTISGDGRLVAFTSFASNLHADDGDATADVFVRDTQTGATTLVSRATGATGQKGTNVSLLGLPATIVGTAGRDVLRGTKRADVIVALGGNDVVRGLGAGDRVCAGAGPDRVESGASNDRLESGPGRDTLAGGAGNDRINARDGRRETVRCGGGKDRVSADRSDRAIGCERIARR